MYRSETSAPLSTLAAAWSVERSGGSDFSCKHMYVPLVVGEHPVPLFVVRAVGEHAAGVALSAVPTLDDPAFAKLQLDFAGARVHCSRVGDDPIVGCGMAGKRWCFLMMNPPKIVHESDALGRAPRAKAKCPGGLRDFQDLKSRRLQPFAEGVWINGNKCVADVNQPHE
jgi:hypothetical protein